MKATHCDHMHTTVVGLSVCEARVYIYSTQHREHGFAFLISCRTTKFCSFGFFDSSSFYQFVLIFFLTLNSYTLVYAYVYFPFLLHTARIIPFILSLSVSASEFIFENDFSLIDEVIHHIFYQLLQIKWQQQNFVE